MLAHIKRVFERDLMPDPAGACDNRFAIKPAVSCNACNLDPITLAANKREGLVRPKGEGAHVSGDRLR
jgi:hypothetical protein